MEADNAQPLTKGAKYHALYREQRLEKAREAYNSRPEVIAKREERERLKAEKDAAKEAARQEKEQKRQEKLAAAIASRKKPLKVQTNKEISGATENAFFLMPTK